MTFATTESTDVTHGETKSKSILEKQQMRSRMVSASFLVSRLKRLKMRNRA